MPKSSALFLAKTRVPDVRKSYRIGGNCRAIWPCQAYRPVSSAAELPAAVSAIVSRGGRPDLAQAALTHVVAPTLLIVGGHYEPVIQLNRSAFAFLRFEKRLEIAPGATHLFEEPGTLDRVIVLARDWFLRYLAARPPYGHAERH